MYLIKLLHKFLLKIKHKKYKSPFRCPSCNSNLFEAYGVCVNKKCIEYPSILK